MKRIISFGLFLVILLSAVSCGLVTKVEQETTEVVSVIGTDGSETSEIPEESSTCETESTFKEIESTSEESEESTSVAEGNDTVTTTDTEASAPTESEGETSHITEGSTSTSEESSEAKKENIEIDYESNMNEILKKTAIVKIGYEHSCIKGTRTRSFDDGKTPYVSGGRVYLPISFVRDTFGKTDMAILSSDGVFATASDLESAGIYVVFDEELEIAIVSDFEITFADPDLLYALALEANNLLAIGADEISAKKTGDRPILFESDEMLAYSKKMAEMKVEPYAYSWELIKKNADYALMIGPKPYKDSDSTKFRFAACDDFVYARYLALAYYNTGDAKYLDGALAIFKAYSESDPILGTGQHLDYSAETINGKSDIGLNIALPLTAACDAYSLIYTYVSDEDRASIEKWLRIEAELVIEGHENWIKNDYYTQQYGNNHLTCHLMGIIAAAYVLEDDALLAYALDTEKNPAAYPEMLDRAILMYGDDVWSGDTDSDFDEGEIYDRYRVVQNTGFGYSLYHLKFLTYCAMMMSNNNVDYFIYYGSNGENLKLPYLTYSEYLIKNDNTLGVGHYSNSPIDRSTALNIYYIAYYYYRDEEIASVISAILGDGISSADIEVFGHSTAYLFGTEQE